MMIVLPATIQCRIMLNKNYIEDVRLMADPELQRLFSTACSYHYSGTLFFQQSFDPENIYLPYFLK